MNWETAKLGEVCTIEKGKIGIMKAIPGEYPLVVLGAERKTHNEFQFDDEAVIIPLVSSTGHGHRSMKRIFFQTGKFSIGSILCAVIPKDKTQLSAEFLYRYLDFNKENELVARMKGMANVSLPMKEIADVEIPLPPLGIQKELIEEFQKLESGKNQISTELSHQLALVKELRQAYLREAMQGKLVPQDSTDEPAEILLKKIKAEREKLFAEKKIKKDKTFLPIKLEEILFETPNNWVWCRLGDISAVYGGKRLPNNYSFASEITPYIYIRITDMKSGTLVDNNLKYISENVFRLISQYTISSKDLYITIAGTIGQVGTVPQNFDGMNLTENAAKIVFNDSFINKIFLKYLLNSDLIQPQFRDKTKAMAQPKLALKRIETTLVALPPLAEQERIVAKLEKLMKFCDELEANIKQGITNADQLLQTALKEALEPK